MLGKVLALARGRLHVSRRDVLDVVVPALSHRVLLDFRARAEGATHAELLRALVERAQALSLPKLSRWTRELLRIGSG
jgi:MoxR-like ATPase